MDSFKNRHILITGASSGIGEELLRQLASQACTLYIASRSTNRLTELAQELSSPTTIIHTLSLDLAEPQSIQSAAKSLRAMCPKIDLLINNAGVSQRGLAMETEFEVVKKIMQVNFMGTIEWTSRCKELLLKSQDPQIIVTSSVTGLYGFPLRSSYAASKHALQGYFETMQLESDSPCVSIVSPGRIQTEISKSALTPSGKAHGSMDPGQAAGIPVSVAARKILRQATRKKKHIYIGKGEVLLIYIHRYFPVLFRFIAKRISAK